MFAASRKISGFYKKENGNLRKLTKEEQDIISRLPFSEVLCDPARNIFILTGLPDELGDIIPFDHAEKKGLVHRYSDSNKQ